MAEGGSQLRRTITLIAAPVAIVAVGALAYFAAQRSTAELERAAYDRVSAVAVRASRATSQYIRDRQRDLELIAQVPDVIGILRDAARETERVGLTRGGPPDTRR